MSARRIDLADHEVCVLSGGTSSEREVSLRTGAAVASALREDDGRGPSRVREIEIRADGRWAVAGTLREPEFVLADVPRDAVWFLALHGGAGEDGTIQGLLRALGRRHTGSGVGASALCMSKTWTREVLAAAGLTVAPALRVEARAWRLSAPEILAAAARFGGDGYAVKPVHGGSSVATSIVEDTLALAAAIEGVLEIGDAALVEARIRGTETTCAVLGHARGELRVLTPVEIVPKDGRFFDYEEKYSSAGAAEFCPPRTIAPATVARIRELSEIAFRAAGCEGYARIDFMIPSGPGAPAREPVVLEINTLPGLTDRSLLPLAAREAGLGYRDLCLEIVRLALEGESP